MAGDDHRQPVYSAGLSKRAGGRSEFRRHQTGVAISLIEKVRFGTAPAEEGKSFRRGDPPDGAGRRGGSIIIIKRRDLHHLFFHFLTHSQPNGKNVD